MMEPLMELLADMSDAKRLPGYDCMFPQPEEAGMRCLIGHLTVRTSANLPSVDRGPRQVHGEGSLYGILKSASDSGRSDDNNKHNNNNNNIYVVRPPRGGSLHKTLATNTVTGGSLNGPFPYRLSPSRVLFANFIDDL
jgi:hypothetical protein